MRARVSYPFVVALLWLSVILCRSAIEGAFGRVLALVRTHGASAAENPMYDGMLAAAKTYDVELPPVRDPERQRVISLRDDEIFTRPPGYYDVIVFGDSSLVWSFSPQIVEQIGKKRVAFFGCESALPTPAFMRLAEQIAHTYLRSGGNALFLFSDWAWANAPDVKQPVPEMAQMVADAEEARLRTPIERALDSTFRLPQLEVYSELVEPWAAEARHRQRRAGAQGMGCSFYSWGRHKGAVFLYCAQGSGEPGAKNAHKSVLRPTLVDDCVGQAGDAHIAANLRALADAKIEGKRLVLPFVDRAQPALVCEAQKLGRALPVLDLPRMAVDSANVQTLDFESATHLANTSSIAASVVLGRAIAELH